MNETFIEKFNHSTKAHSIVYETNVPSEIWYSKKCSESLYRWYYPLDNRKTIVVELKEDNLAINLIEDFEDDNQSILTYFSIGKIHSLDVKLMLCIIVEKINKLIDTINNNKLIFPQHVENNFK